MRTRKPTRKAWSLAVGNQRDGSAWTLILWNLLCYPLLRVTSVGFCCIQLGSTFITFCSIFDLLRDLPDPRPTVHKESLRRRASKGCAPASHHSLPYHHHHYNHHFTSRAMSYARNRHAQSYVKALNTGSCSDRPLPLSLFSPFPSLSGLAFFYDTRYFLTSFGGETRFARYKPNLLAWRNGEVYRVCCEPPNQRLGSKLFHAEIKTFLTSIFSEDDPFDEGFNQRRIL